MLKRDIERLERTSGKIDEKKRREVERHQKQIAAENDYHARLMAGYQRQQDGAARDAAKYENESDGDAWVRCLKADRRTHFQDVRVALTGKRRDKDAKHTKAYNYYLIYRYLIKKWKNNFYPSGGVRIGVKQLVEGLHFAEKTVKRGLNRLRPKWVCRVERGCSKGTSLYTFPRYPMVPSDSNEDDDETLGSLRQEVGGQELGPHENVA